mgnify:CR=1 FL=1
MKVALFTISKGNMTISTEQSFIFYRFKDKNFLEIASDKISRTIIINKKYSEMAFF